jgi:hypothetical protein
MAPPLRLPLLGCLLLAARRVLTRRCRGLVVLLLVVHRLRRLQLLVIRRVLVLGSLIPVLPRVVTRLVRRGLVDLLHRSPPLLRLACPLRLVLRWLIPVLVRPRVVTRLVRRPSLGLVGLLHRHPPLLRLIPVLVRPLVVTLLVRQGAGRRLRPRLVHLLRPGPLLRLLVLEQLIPVLVLLLVALLLVVDPLRRNLPLPLLVLEWLIPRVVTRLERQGAARRPRPVLVHLQRPNRPLLRLRPLLLAPERLLLALQPVVHLLRRNPPLPPLLCPLPLARVGPIHVPVRLPVVLLRVLSVAAVLRWRILLPARRRALVPR